MLKLLKATGNVIIDTMNDELNAAEAAVENEDIDTAIKLVNKHLESGNARAQYLYGLYIKVKYFIEIILHILRSYFPLFFGSVGFQL